MKIAEVRHVEERRVMQCSVRRPVLAVSTLDGDTRRLPWAAADNPARRIFRSLSPQRGVHCPQVAASLIANQGPLGGGGPRPLDIL